MMRDTEHNLAGRVFRQGRAGRWLAIFPLVLALVLALAAGVSGGAVAQGDSGAHNGTAGRELRVGPQRELRSIAAAAQQARAGDTILVDAGDYVADVAVWNLDRLTIRAVGGRARLIAGGASAEGKAIWVIRRGVMVVENVDFIGTRVRDRNGAGIRFESGHLTVINCVFIDNQIGILTNNDPASELVVQNSEFDSRGTDEARSHNLYVGAIGKLTVQGSYFHHGKSGHLLKTRAAQSHILYNRLTDEAGGSASYELEFPNGGVAVVIGNLIAQGAQSPNSTIISYGVEGYRWPDNSLLLAHNTIVDEKPQPSFGRFLFVQPGERQVLAVNNLLVGGAQGLNLTSPDIDHNNARALTEDFVLAAAFDYQPTRGARWLGRAADAGQQRGISLRPERQYVHPRSSRALPAGLTRQIGAFHLTD